MLAFNFVHFETQNPPYIKCDPMGCIRYPLRKTLFEKQDYFWAFTLSSVISSVDLEKARNPQKCQVAYQRNVLKGENSKVR